MLLYSPSEAPMSASLRRSAPFLVALAFAASTALAGPRVAVPHGGGGVPRGGGHAVPHGGGGGMGHGVAPSHAGTRGMPPPRGQVPAHGTANGTAHYGYGYGGYYGYPYYGYPYYGYPY